MIWGYLLHLGYNMWSDRECPDWKLPYVSAKDYLRCDDTLWNDITAQLAQAGANMVVIDLGEGVRYDSHPELGVKGSWTTARLRDELLRLRQLGLEPIPKLNFSTAHDTWLGAYERMVSTPAYYAVCQDLIAEVSELFGKPRLFHIGMDEETWDHQRHYGYAVIRQYDLWWQDLLFYAQETEKQGARAWVWSDYYWHHPEWFLERMPKSILQSNWHYSADFSPENRGAKTYIDLEAHGFDQIPTGSSWSSYENFEGTVRFCKERVAPERLQGFLQTVWKPTLEECRQRHLDSISQLAAAKRLFEQGENA